MPSRPMRLGVAATLVFSGAVVLTHVGCEGLDDRIETCLLVWEGSFCCEFEPFVRSAQVYHKLDQSRGRLS